MLTTVSKGLRRQLGPDDRLTPLAEALIGQCWPHNPDERPDSAQIVQILKEGQYAVVDGVDGAEMERYVTKIEKMLEKTR
jgi:hypothetical protein